jgi:diguanylate cyclase (GGDEF)-like protein
MLRFAVVSAIPMLVLGWGLQREIDSVVERRALDSFGSSAEGMMQIVASTILEGDAGAAGAFDQLDDVQREVSSAFRLEARFRVVVNGGLVVFDSSGARTAFALPSPETQAALAGRRSGHFLESRPEWLESPGRPFIVWVPVRTGDQIIAALEIVGASEQLTGGVQADLRRVQAGLIVGLLALWLLLAPVAASVSRRLSRQAEENRRLAYRDPLTGLANRNLLREHLEHALAASRERGTPVGLLLIDLDRFKEVNDTLGHSSGDELLGHLSAILLDETRDSDTVGRLGGDEFAIIVGGADASELELLANRLLDALRRPVTIDGVDVAVDASIGIACAPEDGQTAEVLMQRADIAMYAAKGAHAGWERYDAEIDLHSTSRLALTAELKRALVSDDEITLHYQPIAPADGGPIRTFEALVRWEHPTRGFLGPAEFVPLAESSGLGTRLTLHVFELAVAQLRRWLDTGLDLTVSVNIGPSDLGNPEIGDRLGVIADGLGVEPARVQIELTETGLLRDPDAALLLVTRLRAHGFRIALDDFGMGSSSLTYLRSVNPDVLKIDRSFVAGLADNDVDASIVSALIELAHLLGMEVTAEGVETAEQWRRLADLRCDHLQGFYLARPVPAAEVEPLLARHGTAPAV